MSIETVKSKASQRASLEEPIREPIMNLSGWASFLQAFGPKQLDFHGKCAWSGLMVGGLRVV